MNTDLGKIIFRKVVGTSEDWPYFYSGLSVAQIQQTFQLPLLQHEGPAYFPLVSHILKQKIVASPCSLSS